jgi:hypothetical protein
MKTSSTSHFEHLDTSSLNSKPEKAVREYQFHEEGHKMKNRPRVPFLIAIATIAAFLSNCATTNRAVSSEDFGRIWCGTWTSTESEVTGIIFRETVFHSDGSYDYCYEVNDTYFCDTTDFTFDEWWIDSEGNVWYRAHWENDHHVEGYSIGKFSNSGNRYEELWKFGDEPIAKWTPGDVRYFYFIWYRKE